MGLIKQIIRALKRMLSNVFGFITRRKRKPARYDEVPRSWEGKGEPRQKDQLIRIKHKRRIPGLREINRFMAGIWLFINFVFSQFLLGSMGSQAQWTFIFFLGNCYFIGKYLWSSRKHERQKT